MIRGLVQGVGFRPFICRMAARHGLTGEVDNRTGGVSVILQADLRAVELFNDDIISNAPPASRIKSIQVSPVPVNAYDTFRITASRDNEDDITEISPDIAVCDDCLHDLQKDPFRAGYPFVNCTNCGPRFTIIEKLPYDRPSTSMKVFKMCSHCRQEYDDILDRRFHAQPVACNSCGPVYHYSAEGKNINDFSQILKEIAENIDEGKIVAIKGTGGYNLICNALNEDVVSELRRKKHRDAKPFAVMFRDTAAVKEYCHLNNYEQRELISWKRPILILSQRKSLAPSVNNGLTTTGAILPSTPVHYLLFRMLRTPAIVYTSGNLSDEPIIADDVSAAGELSRVADAFVSYNRQIMNRVDDSVVRIAANRIMLIRRSRGFVPGPVDLNISAEGVLAVGAEQKDSFCIGRGNQAIMSQYIGDLRNAAALDFFIESLKNFRNIFRFRPAIIACDMHPGYLSTTYAKELANQISVPLYRIQHHHAHIASCMAEHGLDEEVTGISFDGTGLGSDGNIWGGEFLLAGLREFRRYAHFEYVGLPGGDKVAEEPWRTAFSYIYKYFGTGFDYDSLPLFRTAGSMKLQMMKDMLDRKINCPLSSGAGRLFDAVSAILGLCSFSSFDSEAPMRLESIAEEKTRSFYPFAFENGQIIFKETFSAIIRDLNYDSVPVIAARFHNTVARIILDVSERIRNECGINKVLLSGGVFQNRYLMERSLYLLNSKHFRVFTNELVPMNDGGISLGQLIIASKMNTCA